MRRDPRLASSQVLQLEELGDAIGAAPQLERRRPEFLGPEPSGLPLLRELNRDLRRLVDLSEGRREGLEQLLNLCPAVLVHQSTD